MKGRVVFVTGASRGIGEETARFFAKAGASLALVSRKQETLDIVKGAIRNEVEGADIETFVVVSSQGLL